MCLAKRQVLLLQDGSTESVLLEVAGPKWSGRALGGECGVWAVAQVRLQSRHQWHAVEGVTDQQGLGRTGRCREGSGPRPETTAFCLPLL